VHHIVRLRNLSRVTEVAYEFSVRR
jgi:hypothetical protein